MGTCLSHFDYWFLKFLICFCFFIFFCAFVRWYYSQSANSYIQSDFTLLYEIGVGSIIIQLISRVYTAGYFWNSSYFLKFLWNSQNKAFIFCLLAWCAVLYFLKYKYFFCWSKYFCCCPAHLHTLYVCRCNCKPQTISCYVFIILLLDISGMKQNFVV